jgi:hypothetical protein
MAKHLLTSGVSRVRLYASAVLRIASACVGYGWITLAILPRPILLTIANGDYPVEHPHLVGDALARHELDCCPFAF